MKGNLYRMDNNVERLKQGKSTLFLDKLELQNIKHKIKGLNYHIYYLYPDSEKVILYTTKLPEINLYKIESDVYLKHQEILGTLFSLGLDRAFFGDIVNYHNYFYFYILSDLKSFIEDNFKEVFKNKITLQEVDIHFLDNYERQYDSISLIVSSTRLDLIISSLTSLSRKSVNDLFSESYVILNSQVVKKGTYNLKENDTFSIRKYGKYKFNGIKNNTKKDKFVIEVLKYK